MEKYDEISDDEFRMYQILVNEDIMNKDVREKIMEIQCGCMTHDSSNDDLSDSSEDDDILLMDGSNMVSYILFKLQNQLRNLQDVLLDLRNSGIDSQEYYDEKMAEIKVRRKAVKKLRAEAKFLEALDNAENSDSEFFFCLGNKPPKEEQVQKECQNRKSQGSNIANTSGNTRRYKSKVRIAKSKRGAAVEESAAHDAISKPSSSRIPKKKMSKTNKIAKKCLAHDISEPSSSRKSKNELTKLDKIGKKHQQRRPRVYYSSDDSSDEACSSVTRSSKPKQKKPAPKKPLKKYLLRECKKRGNGKSVKE